VRTNRHIDSRGAASRASSRSLCALLAAAALGLLAAGGAAGGPPTDLRVAQQTVGRYFALLDASRGSAFCGESITSATVRAAGGIYNCAASIDGYVRKVERQRYATALENMHYLFSMLSDGITTYCRPGIRCPSSQFARWASKTYPGTVRWRTSTNPRLASSVGSRVVAVVDPRSSTRWITLYFQASDGRIFRASWSTTFGSWQGSVRDTHAGKPFISDVHVVSAVRIGPDTILARVGLRIGTLPRSYEEFRLVREGGRWRADTWTTAGGPPLGL
jgi:hypothetical protein